LLVNVTHERASSIWLEAPSSDAEQGRVLVYRPMGDVELLYLLAHNQLPDTQPYQAIIEGDQGRQYAKKFISGTKKVDTNATTVVEFSAPETLIANIKSVQMKIEDGVMSMGLGSKAGGQLPVFNQSLLNQETTWRIVNVRRAPK
jgi:hypothetical protein